jgi:hypothetical protein
MGDHLDLLELDRFGLRSDLSFFLLNHCLFWLLYHLLPSVLFHPLFWNIFILLDIKSSILGERRLLGLTVLLLRLALFRLTLLVVFILGLALHESAFLRCALRTIMNCLLRIFYLSYIQITVLLRGGLTRERVLVKRLLLLVRLVMR